LSACKFWLTFDEDWFARKVLWSDEKWFVLLQAPSKRNDRYWAEANPHNIIECNKQGGQKCMAWVGILDGRVLPLDKNLVFRMCKNIRKRAQICVAQKGGHFNTL